MKRLLLIVTFFIPSLAEATEKYFSPSGGGSGSSYSDLATFSVANLGARGVTNYVIDGSYGGFDFNTVESGTTRMIIRKATVASHGSGSGWSDAMGDGQATFNGPTFKTGWWEFNGQTRDESAPPGSWRTSSAYGFKLNAGQAVELEPGVDGITIKYLAINGNATTGDHIAISQSRQEGLWRNTLLYSHLLVENTGFLLVSRNSENVVIEYCWIGPTYSKEAISHEYGGEWTNRWNVFWNNGTGTGADSLTATIGYFDFNGGSYSPDANDVLNTAIYGCVFGGDGFGSQAVNDGLIAIVTRNSVFYNNTIIDPFESGPEGDIEYHGTGNVVKNNLWYNAIASCNASTVDDSWVNTSHTLGGTVTVGSENPFKNLSSFDFRIKDTAFSGNAPTDIADTAVPSAFRTDMFGTVHDNIGALATFGDAGEEESAPVITSPLTAVGTNLMAFSYTIGANGATSYGASGLPSGLSLSGAIISGTPTTGPSTNSISITATNAAGYDSETLVLTLYNGIAPSISVQPVAHTNGTATGVNLSVTAAGSGTLLYQWQLASTNLPGATSATYSKVPATTNDSGLYLVTVTNNYGSITSSPAVYVSITNTLAIPEITSVNYTGNVNVAVSYTITATESIDSYGATGLPTGLSRTAGVISGVVTNAGVSTVTLAVTNAFGFDVEDVTFNIRSLVDTNISVGSRVRVNVSPDLRVRDAASLSGNVLGVQNYEAEGIVTGGPTTADGYTWWEVNYDASPDGWSIEGASGVYWLIVAPPDGDTTAPSVTITTPASSPFNSTKQTVTISGTASDNVALASVQLTGPGIEPQVATGTTSWTATVLVPNVLGSYTITVTATDTSSNTATDTQVINYTGATATIQTLRVGNTYISQ